jgi:hypothetical protein
MIAQMILASAIFLSLETTARAAQPDVEIVCKKGDYSVAVANSTLGGRGNGSVKIPMFVLAKNGQTVGAGNLKLEGEGYEAGLLGAYVWAYRSSDDSAFIGVGVRGLKSPSPGVYSGKADLFVTVNNHTLDGSTVPCVVTIK